MSNEHGWVGVDFDGTLAQYTNWQGPTHVGEPIQAMVDRVKQWLKEGIEVRIFTARVHPLNLIRPNDLLMQRYNPREQEANAAAHALRSWCDKHIGRVLTLTCIKDQRCRAIYDDRAFQVVANTGEIVGEKGA